MIEIDFVSRNLLNIIDVTPASLNLLSQPRININLASRGFRHAGHSLWDSLPHHHRSTDSYTDFKSNLKTRLFSGASTSGP